jgi:hypothetical protein
MNTAVDMAQFIAPKSDQLNADDLIAGPRTIRITGVSANEGSPEQPISVSFEGDDRKPYKPCKSRRRVMVHIWGPDASKYVGRAMTLYRDPKVQFGGMQVGGIRISHMSDIPADKLGDGKVQMALTATRAKRAPYTVLPLKDEPAASSNGKDDARAWADTFIRNVGRAPDAGKLDAYVASKADTLANLANDRPELHGECQAALTKRRAEFAPPTDDDPFGEPDTNVNDGGDNDWRAKADEFLASIKAARKANYLDAITDDYREVAAEMPKPLADEVEGALAAKRRELAAPQGGEGK